jgi:hypothetical protein
MEFEYLAISRNYGSIYDLEHQPKKHSRKQISDCWSQSNKSTFPHRQMLIHRSIEHWMESQLIEVMNMKMHWSQFVLIVNLIQMKLMKVIHTMKNAMNQEFQHRVESQLTESLKMKMLPIQSASILNLM